MENLKQNKQKTQNVFALSVLTLFMGQIYINTNVYGFRLSLAVVFLSLFLIYFEEFNPILLCTLLGIFMSLFRSFIDYLSIPSFSFFAFIPIYLPVIGFYLSFGILFKLLNIRSKLDDPLNFIFNLWVCDSFSNIIEALIRRVWLETPFDKVLISIIAIGGIRTLLTYSIHLISSIKVNKFKSIEKEKYYKELVLFTSKLKTELFFLKKSRKEIEDTVSFIHDYYHKVDDLELKPALLKIAKDIHEIKKDYYRVIAGMESTLSSDSSLAYMSCKDILFLIKDSMTNLAIKKNKKILIDIKYNELFTTSNYYELISIINNLVINSIEAIDTYGTIEIEFLKNPTDISIQIKDTGMGIPKDKFDAIFHPGYSTKYDKSSGTMSTGIGLSHVKQLVLGHFNGSISVDSNIGNGSAFIISIPSKYI